MKRLLVIGFFLSCSLNSFSTCIAIYVAENGHIYVAADSRRTFFFNDKYKYESVCKIHNVGATYFAIAGIDDAGLEAGASTALQQNTNIDSAVKSFGTAMAKHYQKLMTDARKYYPDKFKHFLNEGLADVSFFGFSNGEPYIIDMEFMVYLDDKKQVVATYRLNDVGSLNIIGISSDIRSEDRPSPEVIKQNPELYVESLVKVEAKKHPQAVSEPIDLLELSPDGPVWLRKNEYASVY